MGAELASHTPRHASLAVLLAHLRQGSGGHVLTSVSHGPHDGRPQLGYTFFAGAGSAAGGKGRGHGDWILIESMSPP